MKNDKSMIICENMLNGVDMGVNIIEHMELTESLYNDELVESCCTMCEYLIESSDSVDKKKRFDWKSMVSSMKSFFKTLMDKLLRRNAEPKAKKEGQNLLKKFISAIKKKKKDISKSELSDADKKSADKELTAVEQHAMKVEEAITTSITVSDETYDKNKRFVSGDPKLEAELQARLAAIRK